MDRARGKVCAFNSRILSAGGGIAGMDVNFGGRKILTPDLAQNDKGRTFHKFKSLKFVFEDKPTHKNILAII
jgi:hypothetical protein